MSIPNNQFELPLGARLDFGNDWELWLAGDTLATSTWIAEEGITEDGTPFTTTFATVWLKDGELGKTYKVTNTITTAAGRVNVRPIFVTII